MSQNIFSVREMKEQDIEPITDYWLNSPPVFMKGMGVDLTKIPGKDQWMEMLKDQISESYERKKSYCIIWELNGKAVGHSIEKIIL
jgi:hypothetical protein